MANIFKQEAFMTSTKLINYTTREFMSEGELELYITKQNEVYTPEVIEEFIKAGMLRRVLTKLWNKKGVYLSLIHI